MTEAAWAGWLAAFMLLAFLVSNGLRGLGVPFYISRKVVHFGAGVPIGVSPWVFSEPYYILGLAIAFLLLLAVTHNWDFFPGCARKGRWSELWFPISVAVSIASLWHVSPKAAVVPGLWLAFGDGITGLVRMAVNRREEKGWAGSAACFVACAAVAVLVQPLWVGLLGSVAATLAERFCGDARGSWIRLDDNIAMPMAGLAVIGPLVAWV